MPPSVRERYERYRDAELTWDAIEGGKRPAISWNDRMSEDLGDDADGKRFVEIARRMLTGHYYPPDAIDFFGPWMDEGREIRVGDRILQRTRLFPFSRWPVLWAMTEVFAVERTSTMCALGYVTTKRHFGRGVWRATVSLEGSRLKLYVKSFSGPQSWLFWVALPIARSLQLRAWRRALEVFRDVK